MAGTRQDHRPALHADRPTAVTHGSSTEHRPLSSKMKCESRFSHQEEPPMEVV